MEKNLEKSIKRYLKRKIKITLGFIVAFLLSCSFISAEELYIQNNADTGEVEFSKDNSTWGENPYEKNEFKNNVYTNNIELNALVNGAKGISLINENIINVESDFEDDTCGIDNNGGEINQLINSGIIKVKGNLYTNGIRNNYGKIGDLINNGLIEAENSTVGNSISIYGIRNFHGEIKNLINNGELKAIGTSKTDGNQSVFGIENYGIIGDLTNNGLLEAESSYNMTFGILNKENISEFKNNGIFKINGEKEVFAIYNEIYGEMKSIIGNITNNGTIKIKGNSNTTGIGNYANGVIGNIINDGTIRIESVYGNIWGISNAGNEISKIENNGIFEVKGNNNNDTIGIGIYNTAKLNELINKGMIKVTGRSYIDAIRNYTSNELEAVNDGIVFSSGNTFYPSNKDKITNNGLLIGYNFSFIQNPNSLNNGIMFKYNEANKNYEIHGVGENSDTVINAKLLGFTPMQTATGTESIDFTNKTETGKIYNGITDTLVVKGTSSLTDGVVNGYTNAVVFAENEEANNLTLKNTIINGGIAENSFAVFGSKGTDKLFISGESIINGNINLGEGIDMLTVNNTVQINGTLDGGEGADNIDFAKSLGENINILYDISGFENSSVDTKVTLFEKIVSDNGEIKNLTAQVGDIIIKENGELVLRVDGTEKTDEKITGHALYENKGSITAENGGKLTLNTIGFGESEVVDFKNTDLSNLKNEDVKLSSALHKGKINTDDNTIVIEAKTNIDDPEFENMSKYENLKKIHLSIISSGNLKELNVSEEQLGAYLKYRHDIYAGNPYAYSSELSRKTMGMMRNLADKDLKPELNKWAVYGGFTHVDGGTENSYYGKGYYTYDIGSRDIKADTKITGGYFKAEFGKSQDITTGIIFGGNNSETEIGVSNVEGDSFYFGAYAKKYLNNFRFTLGAGFQHGDYKGDRTAVGYEGITETKKYDSNYHDRGFDIYGNIKYSKELGNNFFFEPSFTLSYTYLDQDGAKDEEGTLATETDSQYFDYSSGEINLDLRKSFAGEKLTHSLTAGISYERMLSGYDEEYITGRIKGGTDFDILVPEKEKDIFSLNAKYELETEKGILFDIRGSYSFEHDTNQNEWTVGTGIGYKF